MTAPASSRSSLRPGFARAFLAASALLTVLVLVQAALAGQALYSTAEFLTHGYVGNASFTVGFLAAILAAAARVPGWLLGLAGIVLLLLFSQTGLGYIARDSTEAAAWHIPLGVTVFGLTVLQAGAAFAVVQRGMGLTPGENSRPR